jgi:hypothetical protein
MIEMGKVELKRSTPRRVNKLLKDRRVLLAFYRASDRDFPAAHWV